MNMDKNFKKIWNGMLLSCLIIPTLLFSGGCTDTEVSAEQAKLQTDDAGEDAKAKEGLKFAIWSDEVSYARKVVEAYNTLKGSEEIILEVIPNDEYAKWIENYSDEYGVDIIDLRGNSQLLNLQQQGKLLSLGALLKESNLDVTAYGTMFNEITYEGEYYALPTRSTSWAIYYNKELFDAAGIDYPTQMTWEEYLELAETLSSEETKIWGGYYPPWTYHIPAIQGGYYLLDDDLDPVWESIEFLKQAYESGSHVPYDDIKDRGDECRQDFESGNIAMMINGEWMANMLLEDAANGIDIPDWGIAPLPVPDDVEENTTIGMYQFAGITSVCSDLEKAFDFLTFLCGPEGALIYAKNAIIPAYSNEEIQTAYMEAVGTAEASVFFEAKKVQEQPMWYGYDQLTDLFAEDVRAYLEGNCTLEEVRTLFEEQRIETLR